MARLQIVQNAAARLVTGTSRFASVRPGLRSLHWLPVKQRVQFKALCIVFKALNGTGPDFFEKYDSMVCPWKSLALRASQTDEDSSLQQGQLGWQELSLLRYQGLEWATLPD